MSHYWLLVTSNLHLVLFCIATETLLVHKRFESPSDRPDSRAILQKNIPVDEKVLVERKDFYR